MEPLIDEDMAQSLISTAKLLRQASDSSRALLEDVAATMVQSSARAISARQHTADRRAFVVASETAANALSEEMEKASEAAEWAALETRAAKLSHRDHD